MKARFLAFWLARAPRERAMLGAAAAVILIALLYVALWEPLVNQRAASADNCHVCRLIWRKCNAASLDQGGRWRPRRGAE